MAENGKARLVVGAGHGVPGAFCMAPVPSEAAGRTFAAYGGIYIVASLMWLRIVESRVPDRWDIGGALVCLCGTAVILFAPRG